MARFLLVGASFVLALLVAHRPAALAYAPATLASTVLDLMQKKPSARMPAAPERPAVSKRTDEKGGADKKVRTAKTGRADRSRGAEKAAGTAKAGGSENRGVATEARATQKRSGTSKAGAADKSSGSSKDRAAKSSRRSSKERAAKKSSESSTERAAKKSSESSKERAAKKSSESSKERAAKKSSGSSKERAAKTSRGSSKEPAAKKSSGTSKERASETSSGSSKAGAAKKGTATGRAGEKTGAAVKSSDRERRPETKPVAPLALQWPVSGRKIVDAYGERLNPTTKTVTLNPGVNIASKKGADVRAAAAGRVSLVSFLPGFGTFVIVEHRDGYRTVYARLSRASVATGASVRAGASIGAAAGATVHFEVWRGQSRLDPADLLP